MLKQKGIKSERLLCIIIILIIALMLPAYASYCEEERPKSIAYLDLESVPPAMRECILEARKEIIFSQSWVAEGVEGFVVDTDGNVVETVPCFYDLFPRTWDIPEFEDLSDNAEPRICTNCWARSGAHEGLIFQDNVYLSHPPQYSNSAAFASFNSTGFYGTGYEYTYTYIYTFGVFGNTGITASYNLGYSNHNTGASLGWHPNIPNGQGLSLVPTYHTQIDVRASTYNNVGNWSMWIYASE